MAELTSILQDKWIAYAGIHAHDNATTQSIANGATHVKVLNFGDNDPSRNCTPDSANNKITIGSAGVYRVGGSFSFACDTNNTNAFISLFKNGVEVESVHLTRKIGTAADVGNGNFTGLVTFADTDELDVRLRHDGAGAVVFTFSYMNLNVSKEDEV